MSSDTIVSGLKYMRICTACCRCPMYRIELTDYMEWRTSAALLNQDRNATQLTKQSMRCTVNMTDDSRAVVSEILREDSADRYTET